MSEAKENKIIEAGIKTDQDRPKNIEEQKAHKKIYRGELGRTQFKRTIQTADGATKEKIIETVEFGPREGKGKKVVAKKDYLRAMFKNGRPMFTR